MGGSQHEHSSHLDHGSTTASHRDRTTASHEAPLVMGVGDGSIFTPNTSSSPMMRQAFLRGGDDDDAFGSTDDIEELNSGGHKRDIIISSDEQELQLQLQQQEEDNASPTAVSNVSNDGDDTENDATDCPADQQYGSEYGSP